MEKKMNGAIEVLRDILQSRPQGTTVWALLRERLDKVTPADVEECVALFEMLEDAQQCLGLKKWASLKGYFGSIPRCAGGGGKARPRNADVRNAVSV